ncbi:hypothetical protein Tco_1179224 [Tanacetum coccineum]
MEECHRLLSNKIDLMNPEGHRVVPDIENERGYDISAAYGITTGGLSGRNSTSKDIVAPLIVVQSDPI